MTSFRKDDQGKPRFELIPPKALEQVARSFTHGAKEYGEENYLREGATYRRYLGAAYRHLNAWAAGEDTDAPTGLSHLAALAANALILLEMHRRGTGTDDRLKDTDFDLYLDEQLEDEEFRKAYEAARSELKVKYGR